MTKVVACDDLDVMMVMMMVMMVMMMVTRRSLRLGNRPGHQHENGNDRGQ